MPQPNRLIAPAKLTLSLRVTGVRADGYHLLDAVMVSIDLADVLELGETDGPLEIVDEVAGGLGIGHLDGGPDNLVRQALAAVDRQAAVRLRKRIPVGAGLGGGSADAAAVLRWAGRLDAALGASLGADIPFCVVGGRARVRGIGQEVEPLPFEEQTFVLVLPPFGVETAAVYQAWDAGFRPDASAAGAEDRQEGNDLEPAALAVEPRLAEWRDALSEVCGRPARLAGSGSAWFVEADDELAARVPDSLTAGGVDASLVIAHTIRGTGPDASLPPEGAGVLDGR